MSSQLAASSNSSVFISSAAFMLGTESNFNPDYCYMVMPVSNEPDKTKNCNRYSVGFCIGTRTIYRVAMNYNNVSLSNAAQPKGLIGEVDVNTCAPDIQTVALGFSRELGVPVKCYERESAEDKKAEITIYGVCGDRAYWLTTKSETQDATVARGDGTIEIATNRILGRVRTILEDKLRHGYDFLDSVVSMGSGLDGVLPMLSTEMPYPELLFYNRAFEKKNGLPETPYPADVEVPAKRKACPIIFPCLCSDKLDGIRTLASCKIVGSDGSMQISMRSRSGIAQGIVVKFQYELAELFGSFPGLSDQILLDGEIIILEHNGAPVQCTSINGAVSSCDKISVIRDQETGLDTLQYAKIANPLSRELAQLVEIHIFDCYVAADPNMRSFDRYKLLQNAFAAALATRGKPFRWLRLLEKRVITSPGQILVEFDNAKRLGQEGRMVLNNTPYEPTKGTSRSANSIKLKVKSDENYPIVDICAGKDADSDKANIIFQNVAERIQVRPTNKFCSELAEFLWPNLTDLTPEGIRRKLLGEYTSNPSKVMSTLEGAQVNICYYGNTTHGSIRHPIAIGFIKPPAVGAAAAKKKTRATK
jgi:hypothetical protein